MLKTQHKQLLVYLPLDTVLPPDEHFDIQHNIAHDKRHSAYNDGAIILGKITQHIGLIC